jgi:acyl-CoA reductase-like NAD-dependent aldehyde dehydrogenase
MITSINPSTGKAIGEFKTSSKADVEAAVKLAHATKSMWVGLTQAERSKYMHELCDAIVSNTAALTEKISEEMGMPITNSRDEVPDSTSRLRYYADTAEAKLAPDTIVDKDGYHSEVRHVPYGVAACIAPWNFPLSNFVWVCGQAVTAGNTVVFKHSEELLGFSYMLDEMQVF